MKKEAKRFVISLSVVLLISYSAIISVIGIHSFLKVQNQKQQIFSLTLARQELEGKARSISSQLQEYERGRALLEQSLERLSKESKEKLNQSVTEIKNYTKQIKELTENLKETKKKLTIIEEENKLLRKMPLAGREEQEGIKALLDQKETEITQFQQRIKGLQQELRNKEAALHYNLAVNFSQMRDFENAIIEYEKALNIDPDHISSHYNLGILYEEYRKDYPQAISRYRRYLELAPDAKEAEQVKQWILSLEAKQAGRLVQ